MSVLDKLTLEKRMELNRTRGYKYGRQPASVPEVEFDAYFEFYLTGLNATDRAKCAAEFWAGLDAGKQR